MAVETETKFASAFASNPECKGLGIYQGFYRPEEISKKDTDMERQMEYTLMFNIDVRPSGELSIEQTGWSLVSKGMKVTSGNLGNIDDAVTKVCRIAKGQGGSLE